LTYSLIVELSCPMHGLERYKIKLIRKYNVPRNTITPQFRRRPATKELSSLVIGKSVSERDVERYIADYLHDVGLWTAVQGMRFRR
jgi:hypothetical protein